MKVVLNEAIDIYNFCRDNPVFEEARKELEGKINDLIRNAEIVGVEYFRENAAIHNE